MKSIRTGLALISVLITAGLFPRSFADDPKAKVALKGSSHEGFDTSVRPQDDFFRYVNGGWIAHTEIPPDRSIYGSFHLLRDKSESSLRAIIEEAAAKSGNPQGSEAQKVGDLYKSFMDKARAEELGKKPIEADFADRRDHGQVKVDPDDRELAARRTRRVLHGVCHQ